MSSSGLVVLLVEDNSDDALLLERQLQRVGVEFEPHVVKDGEEAIRYLSGEGEYADRDKFPLPSLILLDLYMPGKSGFEVLTWIREQPSLQGIPVVVLTAADDYESIQKAFSLGANQYLLKMPSVESLRAVIDKLLWTSPQPLRVLLVDDDLETLPLVKKVLEREFRQVDIRQVINETQWQQALDECDFDVVITDFMLHWSNGICIARQVKERHPQCPVLMLTASGDEETAVAALKAGIDDYIVKNLRHIVRLPVAVRIALVGVQRQKSLQEVEKRFQQFFDNLPIGLAIVDANGHIVRANPALAKMLGYPDQQSVKGVHAFNHLVDANDCSIISQLLESSEAIVHETRWKRRDGSVFWGQVAIRTDRDERGNIVSYEVSIIDTTDRKCSEEALRERQQLLERALKWGQEIARATNMESFFQSTHRIAREEIGLDRIGIFIYDPDKEVARMVCGTERDGRVVTSHGVEFGLKGGVFAKVVQSPEGYAYTVDFTAENNLPVEHSMFGVKEHVVVVMKAGEKLVGFLCADNLLTQRPITQTQIEALRLLASYAGVAFENARLLEEREQRTNLLEKVYHVGREISRVTGLESCILQIRNAVINEFGLDRAAIWLYSPETDMFCGTYGTGRNGELTDEWGQRIRGDRSVRKAFQQPSGFFHTKDYEAAFAPAPPIMEGVKEHISISMWAGDKPIGVITADMLLTQRQITPEQIEALRLFASFAAIAIENARLVETLQKQMRKTEILAHLTHLTSQRLDINSIGRAVVRELEEVFAETALIVAMTKDGEYAFIAANSLGENWLAQIGIPLGSGIARSQISFPPEFLRGRDFFVVDDLSQVEVPFLRNAFKFGFCSLAVGLISWRNEYIGAIFALRKEPNGFSEEKTALLHAITDHLAVAFHNARLFEQLQQTIDELRQTRTALIRQERLNALGQMASGIAHDINNALVPILTFSELLENYEDEALREVIKHVKKAVDDIVTTVQGLRTFYRLRNPTEEFEPVNLNEIVRQAVSMTRPRWYDMAQREGVTIEIEQDFDEFLSPIMGNESELRQAFINLLFNAVDAIVAKKEKFGKIVIRMRRHEEWAILEIADTGVGMDEETKQRCFEPFFTTKEEIGNGLGLSMVYGIVQRHEGKIEVESELEQGTMFRLWFPGKKEAVTQVTKPEVKVIKVPSLRVLVIDDDPRVQEALRAMLEHLGHQPIVVSDGAEGIKAFKRSLENGVPFDLVITDLGMPKVSGAEVTQQVKELSSTTPVIVITGWGAEQKPVQSDCALNKPVRLSTLSEAILKVWQQKT